MHEEIATELPPRRLARFAGALRSALGLAVDVALPQLCAACREPVGGEGLCAPCWSKLAFIAPPYCERLGIPFPYDPGAGVLSLLKRRHRTMVLALHDVHHALEHADRIVVLEHGRKVIDAPTS